MKKLLFLICLFASATGFSQTIPNAGFETWTQAGPFLAPSDWATSPNVSQSTLVHAGSYAALLYVDTITNPQTSTVDTIGGLMYTGVQTQGPPPPPGTSYGGFPYTGRPDSLGGWLQFISQQGDAFSVTVQLSKWNNTSGTRDIIGSATMSNTMDIPNYMYVNMGLAYANSETPDTAFIQFSVGDQVQRHIGTSLWVDDLVFITNNANAIAGITSAQNVSIAPNPANASFTLKSNKSGLHYSLHDLQGRYVLNGITSGLNNVISTDHLETGLYLLRTEQGDVYKIQVLH